MTDNWYDKACLAVRCPTCRMVPGDECVFAAKRRKVYAKTPYGTGHYPRFHATRERRAVGEDWPANRDRR